MSEFSEYSQIENSQQVSADISLQLRKVTRRQQEVAKAWEIFLETGDDSFWFWDVPSSEEPKQNDPEYDLETEV